MKHLDLIRDECFNKELNNFIDGYLNSKLGNPYIDEENNIMWSETFKPVLSWSEAINFCNDLKILSYNDWRLPTIKEMVCYFDYLEINQLHDCSINSTYWSATEYSYDKDSAWRFDFYRGSVFFSNKTNKYLVRAVRNMETTRTTEKEKRKRNRK